MWIPVYCPKEEKVKGVQSQVDSGEQEGLPVRKTPRDSPVRVSEILTGKWRQEWENFRIQTSLGALGIHTGDRLGSG